MISSAGNFADLVRDHTKWVAENIGVKSRLALFPEATQFIGVYAEDEDRAILFEGHHRAAAIALAVHQGNPILFSKNPIIALAVMDGEEVEILRGLLQKNADGGEKK